MKHHPDQSRPPCGMLATDLENGLHEGGGGLGRCQATRVVRRRQRVEAAALEPTHQVTNRA
jgi:hypothetical protein